MNTSFKTYRPEGFTTVNPYLFVSNPEELIQFLKDTFHAEELGRTLNEKGDVIRNCILKIGDTNIMVSQASGQFMAMRTALYLYVDDADAMHAHALAHGATEVFAPMDMDYGDRQGGIIDPSGNYWWISKRFEESDYQD